MVSFFPFEFPLSFPINPKLTGMNVSVISHMCAGTQKRFNEKTIQKLESVLGISIPDISNDAEAIIKDMEESQTI